MAIKRSIWSGYKKSTTNGSKKKNKQPEYHLQVAVCNYIKLQYPDVFYNGSSGGVWTTWSQGKKMVATGYKAGFPDLFIYEPRNEYHGLAIELKVKGNYAKKHQKTILGKLQDRGYKTEICTGFDHTKRIIDEYLSEI